MKVAGLFLFMLLFLAACSAAPATVPTATFEGPTSSPAEVVDKFYTALNDAQTKEELLDSFKLITNEAMCSPKFAANCDTSKFQEKWWPVKVTYKLYTCGINVVIAEEARYPRDPSAPSTPIAPRFSRFTLSQTEDGLLIDDMSPVQALEDDCVLATASKN